MLPPFPSLPPRHNWQGLRDALNKTGHPIYYSICPHGHVPPDGPSAPWYKNGTGLGYTPPLSWTESERKETANSLLVEYTNLFDFWYAGMYGVDVDACTGDYFLRLYFPFLSYHFLSFLILVFSPSFYLPLCKCIALNATWQFLNSDDLNRRLLGRLSFLRPNQGVSYLHLVRRCSASG